MTTRTLTIPADSEAVKLLRALKGAPLSCLLALALCHPAPIDRDQLHLMTGWERDKIREAMRILVEVYQFAFVTTIGKFTRWGLTTIGTQLEMPLFRSVVENSTPRALPECEKIALSTSSSSSFISSHSNSLDQETTTTTNLECEKIALSERMQDLIFDWYDGCKQHVVEDAIRTALQRGDGEARVEYRTIAWSLYVRSPLGKGINTRAVFVAKKIKEGTLAPDDIERLDETWRYNNQSHLRRLKELKNEMNLEYEREHPEENADEDPTDES